MIGLFKLWLLNILLLYSLKFLISNPQRHKLFSNMATILFGILIGSCYALQSNRESLWYLHGIIPYVFVFFYLLAAYVINAKEAVFYTLLTYLISDCLVKAVRHANMVFYMKDFLFDESISIYYFLELLLLIFIHILIYKLVRKYLTTNVHVTDKIIILSVLTIIPVFLIGNIEQWLPIKQEDIGIIMSLVRCIVSFCSLTAIVGNLSYYQNALQKEEISNLQIILRKQYEQYITKKETIDELNQKCHDLKHQLYGIQKADTEDKKEYIEDMINTISSYDSMYQTGNEILDVILNDMSTLCVDNKIDLACFVEPNALNSINPIDISTIVSNALRNAIEAVGICEDESKRLIRMKIKTDGNFIIMRFENYYEHQLQWENDILKTTKDQASLHGYGLKGIRMSVEKYGGNLTISTDNNWFILNILIPIANKN